MTDEEQTANDAAIGKLARELVDALASLRDLLAVDAPATVLLRQVDEMERIGAAIDALSGGKLSGSDDTAIWKLVSKNMMKLYEVFALRDVRSSQSS